MTTTYTTHFQEWAMPNWARLALMFVAAVFLAVAFAVLSPASGAYAAICPTPTNPVAVCTGNSGGGQGNLRPGSEQRDAGVAPRDGTVKRAANPDVSVPCTRWSTGKMQPGAVCYIDPADVRKAVIAKHPEAAQIKYVKSGSDHVCAPSGNRPKVGANFNVTVTAPQKLGFRQYRTFLIDPVTDSIIISSYSRWHHHSYYDIVNQYNYSSTKAKISWGISGCVNSAQGGDEKNCYWSLGLKAAQFTPTLSFGNPYGFSNPVNVSSKTNIGSGFAKNPPGFSKGNGPSNCSTNTYASAGIDPDKLGFYYLRVAYSTERFRAQVFSDATFGRGGTVSLWTRDGDRQIASEVYAVHACSPSGNATTAYPTRGALQAAASRSADLLNAAACPQPRWECRAATNTLAGLDANAYSTPAGRNLPSATVLRNGENVPVRFAEVRIIDQANGGNVDVTNGNTGPSVRNISAIDYRTTLVRGSTPYNQNAELNGAEQFFQLRSGTANNAPREVFAGWSDKVSGGWRANANANINKGLSFNWASDGDGSMQVQRQWRVTGEFRIPNGGSADIDIWGGGNGASAGQVGAGGNQGFQWQRGTYECQDYEYRSNGTRYSTGLLTSTSNEVVVVRSANSTRP